MDILKSHRRPVVVVLTDGAPTGINPQCGPSADDWMWISWQCVFGRSWIKQSSDRRTIRMFENLNNTLRFPASWSNLPPSAPATRMHNCNQYITFKAITGKTLADIYLNKFWLFIWCYLGKIILQGSLQGHRIWIHCFNTLHLLYLCCIRHRVW